MSTPHRLDKSFDLVYNRLTNLGGNIDIFNPDDHDALAKLTEEVGTRGEQLGLYLRDVSVATSDVDAARQGATDPASVAELIKSGEAKFVLVATYTIGDLAFSKRVQDPAQDEIDQTVRSMLPDPATELREKLAKRIAEGKSIFDDGDEESI